MSRYRQCDKKHHTVLIWRALHVFRRTQTALLIAMLVALILGTMPEFSQGYVAYRAMTLSDLLANWLGVFIVGFAVSYASWMLLGE